MPALARSALVTFLFWSCARVGASPISLQASFFAAAQRSEAVKQGDERINQVDARHSQALGSALPNLGFRAEHTIQPEPVNITAREFSPANQTTVSLSVNQPLFRGLREFNALSALGHTRSAQQAKREEELNRLFREVAANYLQILTLQQDLKNLVDQSELYETRIRDLRERAQRGESNRSDVLSAEATHAAVIAETSLVQGELEVARETYFFLTGLSRDSELLDPDALASGTVPPIERYLNKLESRPDVKAARETLEATQKEVSVAWGAHSPTIDAYGNYYLMRPGFLKDLRWDVGVRLMLPLFEGGATQGQVTEAVSKRKDAELELAHIRRSAEQEVKTTYQRLRARFDHLAKLKISSELAKKNSELLRKDFERGLVRNIDVQLSLTEYRTAQRAFDKARFATQLDLFQLQAAAAMVPAFAERIN